jgi:hypothetical protein
MTPICTTFFEQLCLIFSRSRGVEAPPRTTCGFADAVPYHGGKMSDINLTLMKDYRRLDQKSVLVYGCYSNFQVIGELQYCTLRINK